MTDDAAADAANDPQVDQRARLFFRDDAQWRVTEREYPLPDRRTGRFLIFESEAVVRRVRNYPLDWFSWSDDDLYSLSLANAK